MLIDYTGHKQGMLTVIERCYQKDKWNRALWKCKCECGREKILPAGSIRAGQKSCGCLWTSSKLTHGGSGTRLYNVYHAMISRCKNPNVKTYNLYGGRGIKVCDEWAHNFEAFKEWAIRNGFDENAPRGKTTIDRIDVDKDYSPENCRICDQKTQSRNTRRNHTIEINGIKKTIVEWSEYSGVCRGTIYDRYKFGVRGMDLISKENLRGKNTNYHRRNDIEPPRILPELI